MLTDLFYDLYGIGERFKGRVTLGTLLSSIAAGVFIAIGCLSMCFIQASSIPYPIVKTLLSGIVFSVGLFSIMASGLNLFTGGCLVFAPLIGIQLDRRKVNPIDAILFLATYLIGNAVGVAVCSIIFKGMYPEITQSLIATATAKFNKSILELIISGFFCNILVCFASWHGRNAYDLGSLFITVLTPVVTFILCGFEHSIADMFFVSYATGEWYINLLKLLAIIFGNVLGGLVFSVVKVRPILDRTLEEKMKNA